MYAWVARVRAMCSVVAFASCKRTSREDQTIQMVMPSSMAHMQKKAMLAQTMTGRLCLLKISGCAGTASVCAASFTAGISGS
ncbi:Uncharacterised protein [Janthinobacterium lividum]|nr:Uncharacterised protein [Janthinobacterium lividum]